MPEQRVMQEDEKWARFGVGLAHTIGGIVATAFGAGGIIQPVGQLQQQALDSAFADRIAPSPVINDRAIEAQKSISMERGIVPVVPQDATAEGGQIVPPMSVRTSPVQTTPLYVRPAA